jgi:hypothetical protein
MSREVTESPMLQGGDEEIAYEFELSAWGTPTSPSVKIYDLNDDNKDVSVTCLSGSASVSGTKVTTPKVHDLTAGGVYRMVCQVTISGNVMSAYCDVYCQVL